ncbi:MAG: L,D-transpeptidase family protein [Campylobacterota bacterium]|nr:L,D-transpeptidase family protein [Campylobacterota bacterium]
MKITLALLLSISLYAEDFALLYQSKGVNALIKALDIELTKKTYWDKKLQNIDTRYGYIEGKNSFLTCNKNDSSLHYFKRDKKGNFKKENTFKALTGKINGDKQKEGDKKTPIGVYKLTKKLNKLDPFYGPLAFVTSYPNLYDRVRGKNGSGIWIHGVPDNKNREKSTKGCIAIDNNDIRCLEEKLDFKNSWLIIDEHVTFAISKESLASVLSQLFSWRYAWLKSNIDDYLSFYDPSFVRFDGMKYPKFKTYKQRIFKKKEKKDIFFSNINVISYPGSVKNLFQISFHEKYRTYSYHFEGEKTLIVKLVNNNIKIIAER